MQNSTRGHSQKGDRAQEAEGHTPLTSTSSLREEATEGDVWDRRPRETSLGCHNVRGWGGGRGCPQINAVGAGRGWAHTVKAGFQPAE